MGPERERAQLGALRERLQRARWRARTAAFGGPEWDAASAEIEEIEAELFAVAGGRFREPIDRAPAAPLPASE